MNWMSWLFAFPLPLLFPTDPWVPTDPYLPPPVKTPS